MMALRTHISLLNWQEAGRSAAAGSAACDGRFSVN